MLAAYLWYALKFDWKLCMCLFCVEKQEALTAIESKRCGALWKNLTMKISRLIIDVWDVDVWATTLCKRGRIKWRELILNIAYTMTASRDSSIFRAEEVLKRNSFLHWNLSCLCNEIALCKWLIVVLVMEIIHYFLIKLVLHPRLSGNLLSHSARNPCRE